MGQQLRMQGKYWMILAGDEKTKTKKKSHPKTLQRPEKRELRRKCGTDQNL
jgi:hypothetical protein